MAKCKECGKPIRAWMALGGACEDCYSSQEESQANLKRKQDAAEQKLVTEAIQAITLTTETSPNLNITKRIEIVTAECAFGMNIVCWCQRHRWWSFRGCPKDNAR